jgi:exonuclease III
MKKSKIRTKKNNRRKGRTKLYLHRYKPTRPTQKSRGGMDGDIHMQLDDHDLVGIDLEKLEEALNQKDLQALPEEKLRKVHKVFLDSTAGSTARLGIAIDPSSDSKKYPGKTKEEDQEVNPTAYQGGRKPHAQFWADPKALGGIPPPNPTTIMMKIITWNIRGLNGRSKQRILRDSIRAENPDILLLQETKCVGKEAETIFQRSWRGCESIHTDSTGASGGLAILWNPNTVTLRRTFLYHWYAHAHFMITGSAQEGDITNVYGPQSQQDKDSLMKRIAHIKTLLSMPNWILGGDFNMILTLEEKKGGTKRLEPDNGKFKTLIDSLNLVDIENRNGTFTWSNRRSGHQQVACHLDRFLVAEELLEMDPNMESLILPRAGSDHWSVAFCLETGNTKIQTLSI